MGHDYDFASSGRFDSVFYSGQHPRPYLREALAPRGLKRIAQAPPATRRTEYAEGGSPYPFKRGATFNQAWVRTDLGPMWLGDDRSGLLRSFQRTCSYDSNLRLCQALCRGRRLGAT